MNCCRNAGGILKGDISQGTFGEIFGWISGGILGGISGVISGGVSGGFLWAFPQNTSVGIIVAIFGAIPGLISFFSGKSLKALLE